MYGLTDRFGLRVSVTLSRNHPANRLLLLVLVGFAVVQHHFRWLASDQVINFCISGFRLTASGVANSAPNSLLVNRECNLWWQMR